jgi:predicted TIM-barrel fold metal-dependent hydrolase
MDNFSISGMREKRHLLLALLGLFMIIILSCSSRESYYSVNDFEKVPKIDAHFHYLTLDDIYLKYAIARNFRLITPIWEGEIPIDVQFRLSASLQKRFPEFYAFLATFPTDSINNKRFAESTIQHIKSSLKAGSAGIKVWKNIGMVLKDPHGRFIMVDDPVFEPIFKFLEDNNIPVIAHLGEPKDCWLPFEEMTDPGDVSYYRNNPQYHMYYHPEVPSYERQIEARDKLLRKHPKLDFTGAHLGSLEWSIYELAKRLDSFPNMRVDLAARMYHLQYQSARNYDPVRNFMIKYQDRIVYGTDSEVNDSSGVSPSAVMEPIYKGWVDNWIYLVSDSTVGSIKGLSLPSSVIDKIYFDNAKRFFKQKQHGENEY